MELVQIQQAVSLLMDTNNIDAQMLLTIAFDVIFYGFSTLIIFDFLIGLLPLMEAVQLKSVQQTKERIPLKPLTTASEQSFEPASTSNSDEATMQYLEMTGCDVDDFGSTMEARQFLDENASWTIETAPIQKAQEIRLSFELVHGEFAQFGWELQKHRTGHYRYRVKVNGVFQKFKTLQDALDWLSLSKRLIQAAAHVAN